MSGTSKDKGDALEHAVKAIESVILRSYSGLSENTFRIEAKKIVVVEGVHHEIDLQVTVDLGRGYSAIFIFECKNWLGEKVGKNEIIVLAEKVKACGAQRGFFVAKSYTRDAIAQAALDSRIELLMAEELDPSAILVPGGLHVLEIMKTKFGAFLHPFNEIPEDRRGVVTKASLLLGNEQVNLDGYFNTWIGQLREHRTNHFNSLIAQEGPHSLQIADTRTFAVGEAILNGTALASIDVTGTVEVYVKKGIVVSAFDVTTRGRFVTVQINTPTSAFSGEFVSVHPTLSDGQLTRVDWMQITRRQDRD
jgi:hypothetical protein